MFDCGRRPPVCEQLLEGERGSVVGGRDVDDEQARLAHVRLVERVHVRHFRLGQQTPGSAGLMAAEGYGPQAGSTVRGIDMESRGLDLYRS
jgi:hypothetical protein